MRVLATWLCIAEASVTHITVQQGRCSDTPGCYRAQNKTQCHDWTLDALGKSMKCSSSINDNVPLGCYTYSGNSQLWFNNGGKKVTDCTSARPCVCECAPAPPTPPPAVNHVMVDQGACDVSGCRIAQDKAQCEAWASDALGKHLSASSSINDNVPLGCYTYSGNSQLWFNNGGKKVTNCTSARPCVCECDAVPTPAPSPVPVPAPMPVPVPAPMPLPPAPSPGDFIWLQNGTCKSHGCYFAPTYSHCKAWALANGQGAPTMSTPQQRKPGNLAPLGCYKFSGTMYFNDGATYETTCSKSKSCLCKCDAAPVIEPVPSGNWRYPYGNLPFLIDSGADGCPDYDVTSGLNNAEVCVSGWKEQCNQKLSADDSNETILTEDTFGCKCGLPTAGRARSDCYQCLSFNNELPLKPDSHYLDPVYAPPMNRRQIIERALGWVVHGFIYNNGGNRRRTRPGHTVRRQGTPETCARDDDASCPQWHYSPVCQGLPQMAWNARIGRKAGPKISCLDALPGDWINFAGGQGRGHQMMFRRWIDKPSPGGKWLIYQMGGGWGKANAAVSRYNSSADTCWRRPNITETGDPSKDCTLSAASTPVML